MDSPPASGIRRSIRFSRRSNSLSESGGTADGYRTLGVAASETSHFALSAFACGQVRAEAVGCGRSVRFLKFDYATGSFCPAVRFSLASHLLGRNSGLFFSDSESKTRV